MEIEFMRLQNSALILSLAFMPFAASAAVKEKVTNTYVPYDADLYNKNQEVISTHAEFLYWTVQEGTIDYAQKMNRPAPSGVTYAIGDVHSASYQLNPGVRVALSYFNAPKYWEVRAQYTHLVSKGKDRVEKPTASDEYLTGTWPHILTNQLIHAHSAIEFNYNLFDLIVDRMFIPNPHLRLRMIAGIGAAWIRQDWKIHYFDQPKQNTTIRNRWDYSAGGVRFGVSGDWFWGKDFYLTGLTSMGIYMGSYNNRSKQTMSTLSRPVRDSNFSDTRPAYSAQFIIGPSWQKNFNCHRIEIFAGYELSTWFNLQEIRRSSSDVEPSFAKETWLASGAVALHGLTTRLTVDF